jgi:hypothetical protein
MFQAADESVSEREEVRGFVSIGRGAAARARAATAEQNPARPAWEGVCNRCVADMPRTCRPGLARIFRRNHALLALTSTNLIPLAPDFQTSHPAPILGQAASMFVKYISAFFCSRTATPVYCSNKSDQKNEGPTVTANPHLIPQLDAYLRQTEPGFAIMIDAPWGAGKTHAVKAWIKDKDHCYISLFGIDSIAGIEGALFNQLLAASDFKLPKGVTQILEDVAKKVTGATIDLTGFHRQQVMKNLPKLLIFDDLERAQMPAPALLAALNRFVELEPRQVILIANETELANSDDYRKWREKVVGRTITLKPETDQAFDAVLASIPAENQRTFLTSQRDLIITVFEQSETGNLRLLLQSVREFAELHEKLPDGIRKKERGMSYLLASFLALSIAYHGGQIVKDDLLKPIQPGMKKSGEAKDGEPPPSQLQLLQERFRYNNHVMFGGHALPSELARRLIGDGYATPDYITTALRDTAIFQDEVDEPWVTLAYWRRRDEADVSAALARVKGQLDRKELVSPTIILHLWGIFRGLAEYGILTEKRDVISQLIKDYVAGLVADGKLPAHPNKRWRHPLLEQSSHGLGYADRESHEFLEIRDHLIAAQDYVYQAGNNERVMALLSLAASDIGGFVQAISGRGNRDGIPDFSGEPIFSAADPAKVAAVLFLLPPEQMHDALHPFEDRLMLLTANADHQFHSDITSSSEHPERTFLRRLRDEGTLIANVASPIRAAQIRVALNWHLAFLDPPPPPDAPE